jgi:hypothetical protein
MKAYFEVNVWIVGITASNLMLYWIVFQDSGDFQTVKVIFKRINSSDSVFFPTIHFYPMLPFIDAKSKIICEYPLINNTD